jgi:hypothetical protein
MVDNGRRSYLPRRDLFGTYMDALRNLARTDVPDRAELIERNIDRYLVDEIGGRPRALERLRQGIHNEQSERREDEDWSVAKDYVRSLQNLETDSSDAD